MWAERRFNRVPLFQAMTVAALLVSGMGVATLGSVKVSLAGRLAIDEARVGGLVSVFGFVMVPVVFAAGFLTDTFGKQGVLIGGSLLMAVSLALIARARRYSAALIGVVLSSAGWAAMVNVGNTLSPIAFPGGMAYANNLANVFFGAGAFLTPLGVAALLRRVSFTTSLSILAGLVAVPAVLATAVDFSAVAAGESASGADEPALAGFLSLLGDRVMWLCGFTLFFYAPLEACTSAWATTYLGEKGIGEGAASKFLSAFWLSFMAARLITAFTLLTGYEATLIWAMAALSIAVLAGVVASRTGSAAATMIVAAGLVYGPIFPTLVAVLFNHFEPSLRGRAIGLLFGIGGVGWTVVPMLIGAYAQRTSVQRGFSVAVGSAIGLTVVALLLAHLQ
jgi:fucose permease